MQGGKVQRLRWQWAEPGTEGAPVASIHLHFEFERYRNKWVGTCVELSTSTYARSRRKTNEALSELVLEHLNLLEDSGERNGFFDKWGIQLIIPPATVDPPQREEPGLPLSPNVERLHQWAVGYEPELAGVGR